MNRLLKIAGGLALSYLLVGGKATTAIFNRFEYELAGIRRRDIKVDFQNGKLVALLNIRFFLKQSLGPNATVTGINLHFSQLGNSLGRINDRQPVSLPNATTVEVGLPLLVGVGAFVDHLAVVLSGGNKSPLAPIQITGQLHLQGFPSVPISTTMNFFSFG